MADTTRTFGKPAAPFPVSGERTAKLVAGAELKVYEGAPHGLFFTEKDKLTADLLAFMGK